MVDRLKESEILSLLQWIVSFTLFINIQNSGLTLIVGRIHGSQVMRNLPNPPQQYSNPQNRAGEIEKYPDEGLEPTYYLIIFRHTKLVQVPLKLLHSLLGVKTSLVFHELLSLVLVTSILSFLLSNLSQPHLCH